MHIRMYTCRAYMHTIHSFTWQDVWCACGGGQLMEVLIIVCLHWFRLRMPPVGKSKYSLVEEWRTQQSHRAACRHVKNHVTFAKRNIRDECACSCLCLLCMAFLQLLSLSVTLPSLGHHSARWPRQKLRWLGLGVQQAGDMTKKILEALHPLRWSVFLGGKTVSGQGFSQDSRHRWFHGCLWTSSESPVLVEKNRPNFQFSEWLWKTQRDSTWSIVCPLYQFWLWRRPSRQLPLFTVSWWHLFHVKLFGHVVFTM